MTCPRIPDLVPSTLVMVALALLLSACGGEEAATAADPEPAEATQAEPETPPAPDPPAEPAAAAEVPDCPDDRWSVAANGPNQATDSGVEAAGWARSMGSSWTSLRVCKTVDGQEINLSCAPLDGGAECELSLADERCTATLPRPLIPVAVGQLVDTGQRPSEGSWSCR